MKKYNHYLTPNVTSNKKYIGSSKYTKLSSLPAPTPRSVASVELLVALVLAMEVMEVMALGMEDMQLDMEAM